MNFFLNNPLTVLSFIGLTAVAGVWFVSRVRKNDMDSLREFNKDLIARDEERGKQIAEMGLNIKSLQDKVLNLEKHNKTLEDLVTTALKQYFFENPVVAQNMQKKILGV